MEAAPLDRLWVRSRMSVAARVRRLRSKSWHIAQCALAAGAAWLIASVVLDHQTPFFAPIAAVVTLGTSFSQRWRRVAEVTVGVAMGVLVADLLISWIDTGWWQLTLIVALAMSVAFLLDGSQLLVNQAAVQSIIVATLLPNPDAGFTRWTDALVGGGVALVAATVVPRAPLRRPREQAALVATKIATLLRAAADAMVDGEVEPALDLLADARSTDYLIREMQLAADEGMAVVAASPFRQRHRRGVRHMAQLVEPLDRALRSTRVLVRQTAVAAYHGRTVPHAYAEIARELADAVDVVAEELQADRMAIGARDPLLAVGAATGRVDRSAVLSAEVVLAQLRSVVADLLLVTGLDPLEASDALPPPSG